MHARLVTRRLAASRGDRTGRGPIHLSRTSESGRTKPTTLQREPPRGMVGLAQIRSSMMKYRLEGPPDGALHRGTWPLAASCDPLAWFRGGSGEGVMTAPGCRQQRCHPTAYSSLFAYTVGPAESRERVFLPIAGRRATVPPGRGACDGCFLIPELKGSEIRRFGSWTPRRRG